MLKLIDRDNDSQMKKDTQTPQRRIENELTKIVNLGNLECAYLFSEEGLLLAGIQGRSDFDQNQALEIAYSVRDAVSLFEANPSLNGIYETLLVSATRQKVCIRTFRMFDQQVTLVLLVPRGKTYRSHTNRLIRIIQTIGRKEIG